MFMILRTACFNLILIGLLAESSRADLFLSIDDYRLLPDTPNQEVIIWATFSPSASSTLSTIGGLQLNIRIGDGSGAIDSAPVFQGAREADATRGLSFANTIWDGSSTDIIGEAPIPGFPQYASVGIGFASNANTRSLTSTQQVVARLFVDTRGINSGSFDLVLDDDALGASFFISSTDVPLPESTFFRNGSFTVAVPEPSSTVLFGCLSVWSLRRQRRKI